MTLREQIEQLPRWDVKDEHVTGVGEFLLRSDVLALLYKEMPTETFTARMEALPFKHGVSCIRRTAALAIAREADETIERLTEQINRSNRNYLAAAREAGQRLDELNTMKAQVINADGEES